MEVVAGLIVILWTSTCLGLCAAIALIVSSAKSRILLVLLALSWTISLVSIAAAATFFGLSDVISSWYFYTPFLILLAVSIIAIGSSWKHIH